MTMNPETPTISPQLTEDYVQALFDSATIDEHQPTTHSFIMSAVFPHAGGFVLFGENACSPLRDFDIEYARQDTRGKILDQLWLLEAYRLACDTASTAVHGCLLQAEVPDAMDA